MATSRVDEKGGAVQLRVGKRFADSLSSSSFTADVTTTLPSGSHALPAAPLSHYISAQPLEAWLNAHAVPCAAAGAGMILGGDDGVARVVLRRGAANFLRLGLAKSPAAWLLY